MSILRQEGGARRTEKRRDVEEKKEQAFVESVGRNVLALDPSDERRRRKGKRGKSLFWPERKGGVIGRGSRGGNQRVRGWKDRRTVISIGGAGEKDAKRKDVSPLPSSEKVSSGFRKVRG